MMDAFGAWTREHLYKGSTKYFLEDNTNRHVILHGPYDDHEYGEPINIFKIISALVFCCQGRSRAEAVGRAIGPDGQEILPPPPQPSPAQQWVKVSGGDDLLADALTYFARGEWFDLYKVIECLKHKFGGENIRSAVGLPGMNSIDSSKARTPIAIAGVANTVLTRGIWTCRRLESFLQK
jgi:hypothetical protein